MPGGELPQAFSQRAHASRCGCHFLLDHLEGLDTSLTPRQPSPAQHAPGPLPTDNHCGSTIMSQHFDSDQNSPEASRRKRVRGIGYQLPTPRFQGSRLLPPKNQCFQEPLEPEQSNRVPRANRSLSGRRSGLALIRVFFSTRDDRGDHWWAALLGVGRGLAQQSSCASSAGCASNGMAEGGCQLLGHPLVSVARPGER